MNVSLNAAWIRLQGTVQGLIANLPDRLVRLMVLPLFLGGARLVRRAVRAGAVRASRQVLEGLEPVLLGAGIDLSLPTRQVLFHDQTEATDGDRSRQREGWPARATNPPARHALEQERAGSPVPKGGPA